MPDYRIPFKEPLLLIGLSSKINEAALSNLVQTIYKKRLDLPCKWCRRDTRSIPDANGDACDFTMSMTLGTSRYSQELGCSQAAWQGEALSSADAIVGDDQISNAVAGDPG